MSAERFVGVVSAALVMAAGVAVAAGPPPGDGIEVPAGFTATVVHEGIGAGRHIAIRANGDLYLSSRNGGLHALRDTNGDFVADETTPFGDVRGTGILLFDGYLYASDNVAVYRYKLDDRALVPTAARETVVSGFPVERSHADKTFAIDPKGTLYVNVGAPSNSCQEQDRQAGSPGRDPCPILEKYGGVWVFDAKKLDQKAADGRRFATGMRNAVALEWNGETNALYSAIHGRDSLDTIFPALFTAADNATRPSEEFHRIVDGGDYGWPYTFWDLKVNRRVVAPEYGGDGKKLADKGKYPDPLVAFPAHFAPNDLVFHPGKGFPKKYRAGVFVAFHGSWNRAPEPQAGYQVVFQPLKDGKPTGKFETFADGFAGEIADNNPRNARYRPTGLAVHPDGSLYVVDSQKGRVWRIAAK
jgi:glucose/arabinose dehydrogenase